MVHFWHLLAPADFVVEILACSHELGLNAEVPGFGEVHQVRQDVAQADGGVLAGDTAHVVRNDLCSTLDAFLVMFPLQFRKSGHSFNWIVKCGYDACGMGSLCPAKRVTDDKLVRRVTWAELSG